MGGGGGRLSSFNQMGGGGGAGSLVLIKWGGGGSYLVLIKWGRGGGVGIKESLVYTVLRYLNILCGFCVHSYSSVLSQPCDVILCTVSTNF